MSPSTSDPLTAPEATAVPYLRHRLRHMVYLIRVGFSLVWESSRSLTVGVFVLMLLEAALAPVQLALTGITIDSITARLVDGYAGSAWSNRLSPTAWILIAAMALLLRQLLQPILTYVQTTLGDRTTIHVGERLLETTNRWHGIERFENPRTLDDLKNAISRGGNLGVDLLMQAGPLITLILTAGSLCIALAALHPLVPILIVAATLPRLVVIGRFQHIVYSHISVQVPAARRLAYLRDLPLWPREARDFRLFEMGDKVRERYGIIWQQVTEEVNELRATMGRQQVWSTALSQLASGGVVLLVVWRATRGEIGIGQLALYTGAVAMLNGNLLWIGVRLRAAYPCLPAVDPARPRRWTGSAGTGISGPARFTDPFRDRVRERLVHLSRHGDAGPPARLLHP